MKGIVDKIRKVTKAFFEKVDTFGETVELEDGTYMIAEKKMIGDDACMLLLKVSDPEEFLFLLDVNIKGEHTLMSVDEYLARFRNNRTR